jgi:hypothetical protein
MGEVHEDLIVKLAQVIDGVVEGDVQDLSPAHGFIQRDPHEEGSLADAVTGDNDSDVSGAESAMD